MIIEYYLSLLLRGFSYNHKLVCWVGEKFFFCRFHGSPSFLLLFAALQKRCDFFGRALSTNRIAVFVKRGRHDADAGDAGKDEEEDPTDTGFGGVADIFKESLTAFVESVVLHVVQDVVDIDRGSDTATGGGLNTSVGQGGGHGGDIAARDQC